MITILRVAGAFSAYFVGYLALKGGSWRWFLDRLVQLPVRDRIEYIIIRVLLGAGFLMSGKLLLGQPTTTLLVTVNIAALLATLLAGPAVTRLCAKSLARLGEQLRDTRIGRFWHRITTDPDNHAF